MKTFAAIFLPVFIAIWPGALIGGFVLTYRALRQAVKRRRENPCPVPLRARLRESRRLAWYKLTKRPRYKGGRHERSLLTAAEQRVFARIVSAEKRRQPLAPEPQYRRQP